MKELSLNILDIAENSVKAKANLTEILLNEDDASFEMIIKDDGSGMPEEIVKGVTDPFYTTRTTRKVGLGLPLLKMAAEQTGGGIEITSSQGEDHGTTVKAVFYKNHLDFTPLGDVVSTMTILVQGHPDTDFLFVHKKGENEVKLDTRELREVLGADVPLNEYEVIKWISEFLREQYESF